jgi:formate dehydrogenase subunit gamma
MQRAATAEDDRLNDIALRHRHREGPLLPILHEVQAEFGYIPDDAALIIGRVLNLSRAEVHGVISFYHDFRREPAGRHVLKVCRAEACQAAGGRAMAERLKARLGIEFGETAADRSVTLEPIYCLGLCAVAPAVMLDGEVIGRVDGATIDRLAQEIAR